MRVSIAYQDTAGNLNSDVLTFNQFLVIQQKSLGGPVTGDPFDRFTGKGYGPPTTYGFQRSAGSTPGAVYARATQNVGGNQERMDFTDDKGKDWNFQWCYALPIKPPPTNNY